MEAERLGRNTQPEPPGGASEQSHNGTRPKRYRGEASQPAVRLQLMQKMFSRTKEWLRTCLCVQDCSSSQIPENALRQRGDWWQSRCVWMWVKWHARKHLSHQLAPTDRCRPSSSSLAVASADAISLQQALHESVFPPGLSASPPHRVALCWDKHCQLLPEVLGLTAKRVATWSAEEVRHASTLPPRSRRAPRSHPPWRRAAVRGTCNWASLSARRLNNHFD